MTSITKFSKTDLGERERSSFDRQTIGYWKAPEEMEGVAKVQQCLSTDSGEGVKSVSQWTNYI